MAWQHDVTTARPPSSAGGFLLTTRSPGGALPTTAPLDPVAMAEERSAP
jgi:hypothetical protein